MSPHLPTVGRTVVTTTTPKKQRRKQKPLMVMGSCTQFSIPCCAPSDTPVPNKPTYIGNSMAKLFISYLRVSTGRQQVSGLGLEAQREQVAAYIQRVGGQLLAEHIEVESGKVRDRPVLVKSIARCRAAGATLAIAKLDRLARSVAFIASLMEAGTDFVAVDMPFANKLMLHLMAAFAEHERGEISARTKAALAAAKARGVQLGSHGRVLAEQHAGEARAWSEQFRGPVAVIRSKGAGTVRDVASRLNEAGYRTRNGQTWGPSTAYRLLHRLDMLNLPA